VDVQQPKDLFEPRDNQVAGDGDAPGFAVFGVEPARGPISGGTRVRITGIGFLPGSEVVFEGSLGLEPVVLDERTIEATTPPHPPGTVEVRVVRPDQKLASLPDAFFYEPDVSLEAVTPAAGPVAGGTPVVIRGTGFLPDSRVVIGGRLAIQAHVLDLATILAMTPPGMEGFRDVMVVNQAGVAAARRAFRYVAPPEVVACSPRVLASGRTREVLVSGKGLDLTQSVHASGASVALLEVFPAALKIALAPIASGPMDITVTTPSGTATGLACAYALSDSELSSVQPRVFGVSPPLGPTAGGYERSLIVSGIGDAPASDLRVRLDGAEAPVLGVSEDRHVLRVQVPAHPEASVDVNLATPSGSDVAVRAFEYVPTVTLTSIAPASGPESGGTEVVVSGTHLDRVASMFVGPLPATILEQNEAEIRARTAPANPGVHDVRAVTTWGEVVRLSGAFTFGSDQPSLIAVSPFRGSIAGGTLVAVVGSALDRADSITFGGAPAQVVSTADPARVLVRTPPGSPGPVDVTARWPDGTTRTAQAAYTYFDPTGYFGGVWGEPVSGAVNVTVLDGYNGKPIPLAFAILGSDAATPYRGTTDLRGQVTLSGEDLAGPVQVTATREDYSTATIAGVDAENVTVFLDPVVPTSSGGGGTSATPLPPGTVEGRVLGADKYLLAPPGTCADRPLIHGPLCAPCTSDAECGDGWCVNASGSGSHCASRCLGPADCPADYACYPLSQGQNGCLPSPGDPEVQCGTSMPSLQSFELDPGPGYLMTQDGRYALNSRLGDVAVYCVGGLRSRVDGSFRPIALGVLRHVAVYPAQVTAGQDVRLDIPLDRSLTVRLLNAPGGPGGPNRHVVRVGLFLGSDGYLRLWPDQTAVDAERFEFFALPRSLSGALDGATLELYAEANSNTPNDIPYSVSTLKDFEPGRNRQVVRFARAASDAPFEAGEVIESAARPDALSGCAGAGGAAAVVSSSGQVFQVGPQNDLIPMPSPTLWPLRGCVWTQDGRVLVVGDHGLIARVGPAVAETDASPTLKTLRGVAIAPDGTEYAVGDGVILRRPRDAPWRMLAAGTEAPFYGVSAMPDGGATAVGASGTIARVLGDAVTLVRPAPTSQDLLAVATVGPGMLAVGAHGVAFFGIGEDLQPYPAPLDQDLQVVLPLSADSALVGGAGGSVLQWRNGSWTVIPVPGFFGDLTALVPDADRTEVLGFSRDVAVIGPFLRIPSFSSPDPAVPWTNRLLAWDLDGPPDPSLTYTRISGAKSGKDWTILAAGSLRAIGLPDLTAAAGQVPLPSGAMRLYALQILMDQFNINSFDTESFSTSVWRSWTVQQFTFQRP